MNENLIKYGQDWLDALLHLAVAIVIAVLFTAILTFFLHKTFEKWFRGKRAINVRYLEKLIRIVIILLALFWVINSSTATSGLGRMLFQGTALIGAVAGFAAQPVITDLFCGLMISTLKPFELGDRIELEDGTGGIVKDITVRHVVLRGFDMTDLVIPNSKLNAMRITNMSHGDTNRSYIVSIQVSYDSDMRRAMKALKSAVEESPYTLPLKREGHEGEYSPVYFMEYGDSGLLLKTTIYYESKDPTEAVVSDVNLRILEKLNGAGIEIPYNYVNVVMKDR